jgi:hypothetical protein
MSDLLAQIQRYGQAREDAADPRKSLPIRTASAELAERLYEVIALKVQVLEQRRP